MVVVSQEISWLKIITKGETAMAKFRLHWLSGKIEEVEGSNIADACRKAGIGRGALAALDYYEKKDPDLESMVQVLEA